jgi:hypothetical protein
MKKIFLHPPVSKQKKRFNHSLERFFQTISPLTAINRPEVEVNEFLDDIMDYKIHNAQTGICSLFNMRFHFINIIRYFHSLSASLLVL